MATDPSECTSKAELSTKNEDNKPDISLKPDTVSTKAPTAVREDLVATAVHFLQNPRVQKSPFSHKRAFLLKKGLTEMEVDMALDKAAAAGPSSKTGIIPNTTAQQVPVPGHPGELALSPFHPGQYVVVTPPTIWQRWRELCSSAVVVGATCYGIYYVYKQYLEPALIGTKRIEEDRLDRVERHLLELNKSLSQLRSTLVAVETSLAKQQSVHTSKMELEQDSSVEDVISLAEIKAEMSSIKALLLSRKQFPATAAPPNIPAWQMEQQENDQKSSPEETVPKRVMEDGEEDTHLIPNGVTMNGDSPDSS